VVDCSYNPSETSGGCLSGELGFSSIRAFFYHKQQGDEHYGALSIESDDECPPGLGHSYPLYWDNWTECGQRGSLGEYPPPGHYPEHIAETTDYTFGPADNLRHLTGEVVDSITVTTCRHCDYVHSYERDSAEDCRVDTEELTGVVTILGMGDPPSNYETRSFENGEGVGFVVALLDFPELQGMVFAKTCNMGE